jgi:hypothetical protein
MHGIKFLGMAIVMVMGTVMLMVGIAGAPHLATPGAILVIGSLLCGEIAQIAHQVERLRAESSKKV